MSEDKPPLSDRLQKRGFKPVRGLSPVDLTAFRLSQSPMQYTVVLVHDGSGMHFTVYDVQDDERSHLAVADDLEAAAKSLRERYSVKEQS